MQEFPHHYRVTAVGAVQDDVELTAEGLPCLRSESPSEFGGPGDRWSPETMLVGAVADCFVLTFRAVARASRLTWMSVQCDVTGTLDRIDRVTQFTHLDIHAHVTVPAETDVGQARRALEKAERGCLIANSLKATVHLEPVVDVIGEPVEALAGLAR
jgi:peroxiredoxin-like protein